MKKRIRWFVVGIILCIVSIWGIMLYSDYRNISKEEDPIFCIGVTTYDFVDPNIYAKRYVGIIYNIDEITFYQDKEQTFYKISFFNKDISKVLNEIKEELKGE